MQRTRVYDGPRILEFSGKLIAYSDSYRRHSLRWIEFFLYLTNGNQYVVSRVGRSLVYHLPDCHVAVSNRLPEESRGMLQDDNEPCPECNPHLSSLPLVSFEREKYRAEVCKDRGEVIRFLVKKDPRTGNPYLTKVAQSLLEIAFDGFEWIEEVS